MSGQTAGLGTQIFDNQVKSAFLLAGFPFLLVVLLGGFFSALNLFTQFQMPHKRGVVLDAAFQAGVDGVSQYGQWAILVAGVWFVIAYFMHGNMMRMATGARPITRQDMPKIYNMLENLCISRGIPMPQFEMVDSPALNAFATGIDQKSYRIVLTRGLIETLPDDELEAVIGHELTHILNGDVRLLIIAVIFVGMISFFAQMIFRMMTRGMRFSSNRSKKGGGGALVIMLIALVVLAVGYVCAIAIRFALSRRREFLADAGSVDLTKNPGAMMRALLRIAGHDEVAEMPSEVQQMCIENSHNFMGIFATHPSIAERVNTISSMTGTPVPAAREDRLATAGANPWG